MENKVGQETTAGLSRFTVYKESELRSRGHRFASMKTNRPIQKNALNKKKKSINKAGVLSPCTVVPARKCLLQGLEIIDEAGIEVTSETPDLDKILVIVDGGHRFEAVKELNLKRSESDRIECYFTIPFNDNVPVYELLRQSNIVTTPWSAHNGERRGGEEPDADLGGKYVRHKRRYGCMAMGYFEKESTNEDPAHQGFGRR